MVETAPQVQRYSKPLNEDPPGFKRWFQLGACTPTERKAIGHQIKALLKGDDASELAAAAENLPDDDDDEWEDDEDVEMAA